MATRVPAPVDTGVTPVVTGPVDRAPVPVPAGPGTTGQIPTVKTPQGPPEAVPPAVTPSAGITVPPVATPQGPPETVPPAVPPGPATGQSASATATTTVPVQELPVDTANVDAGTTIIPTINYIQVLANGTVVVAKTTAMNFAGSGVTVTGSNGTATITISGGGSSYGNSNVVTLLSAFGSNTVSTTGNVTGGNVITSAQVIATGVIQTGTGFSTGGYLSVNGDTDLHKTNVTGNLSATGNVTGSYILGNGSQLTGIAATYGNANVVANLAALGTNPVSTTGNVTASYVFGNGSQLTGLPATYGNANVVANLAALGSNPVSTTGNITGGNILGGANVNATTHTGTTVSVSANVTGGNVLTGGLISATSTITSAANVTGGNLRTTGLISATGNITGGNLSAVNLVINNITSDDSTLVSVQDGLQVYGNITADNLGNIAAINLTGSSSNVLYGNGTFAPAAGGGSANTGNVTFDDVNIIGTGNLNLQPNSADAAAYVNIYLTGAADIHMAAGAAGANLILGTDEEANVAVLSNGNVAIQAGNVGGTKTWTFDTAGNLTLPMDSVVYETNIPDQGLNGSAIALKPAGGTTANQQLLIYPTANDGDHIHLTSGNLYTTELFLGSDNLYVKLANTGNVVINSNDAVGNSAQWTFATTGALTAPGSISAVANVQAGNIRTVGLISATGNVYGTNLTDKATGSWTVATGTNTYSITVPINGAYQMWVRCNIPNGIFVYQATVSVTNTNVPVLGTQRAWNYTGGGSPILLTTMPTQIVGTDGTISTAVVSTTTANRFDFVINNSSGSSQTVAWGYVTL